jgi:hypothetical protein
MSQQCHIAWLIAAAQNTHQTTEEEPRILSRATEPNTSQFTQRLRASAAEIVGQ